MMDIRNSDTRKSSEIKSYLTFSNGGTHIFSLRFFCQIFRVITNKFDNSLKKQRFSRIFGNRTKVPFSLSISRF